LERRGKPPLNPLLGKEGKIHYKHPPFKGRGRGDKIFSCLVKSVRALGNMKHVAYNRKNFHAYEIFCIGILVKKLIFVKGNEASTNLNICKEFRAF